MIPAPRWWHALALLVLMLPLRASSQITEFLPEIDVYTGLNHDIRFWFQAKQTREDSAPTQAEIGPSLDFYVKTLAKLKKFTIFDLDDSKKTLLLLSVGYRYLPSPDSPSENRILLMATPNLPLKGSVLVSDRNRLEINFTNGNTYWRYRNKLTLQRTIAVHSYHPSPYASAEFYYNSKYGKWSATTVYAGCIFPLGKKLELDPYYEHANATGVSPNQQTNAFGLILNMFFRRNQE
jgi:uncharacterized protein DUF2490